VHDAGGFPPFGLHNVKAMLGRHDAEKQAAFLAFEKVEVDPIG